MAGGDALGSVLFGQPNQTTVGYFDSVRERISQKADFYLNEFVETSKQIYDSIYSSRALELSRAAINKAGALFTPDVIKELRTITELQTAKPIMRSLIMANPVVRERWQAGRCVGYGENYFDFEPGEIGENHYDFRRVMTGVVHEDVQTNELVSIVYIDELREGDEPLTVGEQLDALNSWDNVEAMMALAAKDPTSEWNCDL